MICPTCDRETAAVVELGGGMDDDMTAYRGGKPKRRCGHRDCKAALPAEKPVSSPSVSVTFTPTADIGSAEKALTRLAAANGAPPSFAQIVAQSEARLLQVRERIAELRSLETEEKQLVLILTAAGKAVPENKPS